MPAISECGGKMHLREEEFDKAATDFFEVCSFLLFSAANRCRRIKNQQFDAAKPFGKKISPLKSTFLQ